ncbi:hypothetical protein HZB01_00365 [Candidatus Woesearchaeota archaeon]|nr:hypothetical protein [Candidatus Woesearchaeota archaeon]
MFTKTAQTLGSTIKAGELLAVLKGHKPVARFCLQGNAASSLKTQCTSLGLAFLTADFKLALSFTGNYSTKASLLPKNEDGYTVCYISLVRHEAEKAKKAESQNNHTLLGTLLGYPPCCVAFFGKNASEESAKHNDFVLPCLHNSQGNIFPWKMNIFGRYFDFSLLSHCPCSLSCKPSFAHAQERFALLQNESRETAIMVEGILKSAAIYNEGQVYLLRGEERKRHFTYTHVLATKKDALYNLLKQHKNMQFRDKIADLEQKEIGLGALFS